jgi:hypothetical protein
LAWSRGVQPRRAGAQLCSCAPSSHYLRTPRELPGAWGFRRVSVLSGMKRRKEPATEVAEPQNPRLLAVESSNSTPRLPGLHYNLLGPPL